MDKKPQPPPVKETPDFSRIKAVPQPPGEVGGPQGPEPTRYGDWEQKGRCTDF